MTLSIDDRDRVPDFDPAEAAGLRSELNEFFKQHYRFILPGMLQLSGSDETPENQNFAEIFSIDTHEKPVYELVVNGASDVKNVFSAVLKEATIMVDAIDNIYDQYEHEKEIDVNVIKAMDMFSRLVNKFKKKAEVRFNKFTHEDANSVAELREAVYRFLAELLKDYLINRLIPSILTGMQGDSSQLYSLFVRPINDFLSAIGIRTLKPQPGEKVDFDTCCPIDSTENYTTDFKLREVIKEVRQLPYLFDDHHLVCEGQAVIWRFDNDA